MLRIFNRLAWFIQALALTVPPIDIPGVKKATGADRQKARPDY